jgi:hypothetical protein
MSTGALSHRALVLGKLDCDATEGATVKDMPKGIQKIQPTRHRDGVFILHWHA